MSNHFVFIEDCKNDTIRIIKEINNKIEKLEDIYKEYLQEATQKEEHMMTLDILFFQIQLTKKDIDNYASLFNSFLSTVYGQYYKLYTKITHSLNNVNVNVNVNVNEVFNDTPVMYDFNPYDDINEKKYSWDEITKVHDIIITIINLINLYISRQKFTVEDDQVRIKRGININHLVYQKKHDIEVLSQEIKLFDNILISYYDYQKKFLRRLMLKLKLLFIQIDTDIQFETVTYKNDLVDENKRNDKLEKILLSELDITQSPIKRKPNINVNVFTTFFSFLLRKTMWLICIR